MRIAQVTDLHLRQHQPGTSALNIRRAREMASQLQAVLARLKTMDIDLLVLTGDLLDAPLWLWMATPGFETDEHPPWLTAIEKDYRLIKHLLDDSGLRYIVLPGNHDHEPIFWQVFGREQDVWDVAGHRVVRFCDRETDGRIPRRFTTERVRFNTMLADESSPPQVHLQHYVIHPMFNGGYPVNYLEAEELARRTTDSGKVCLSLSGHHHSGTDLVKLGETTFAIGPAFCNEPHPWRVYDLSGQEVTVEDHVMLDQPTGKRPVVYLDRDGVINDLASYRYGPEAMRLIPGAGQAIAKLNQAGIAVVGITSQSCIGSGYVDDAVVHCVHDKMHRLLAEQGGYMDAMYYSTAAGARAILPRYKDLSTAKPMAHHLFEARDTLHLDLTDGWMVGDRLTDVQAGRNAGVRPIFVRTGNGKKVETSRHDELVDVPIVDDLAQAVDLILSKRG